jgi:hypothetical protein
MKEMNLSANFTNDVAHDLEDVRESAERAESSLRVLRDVEMGWVGGGDGAPIWN